MSDSASLVASLLDEALQGTRLHFGAQIAQELVADQAQKHPIRLLALGAATGAAVVAPAAVGVGQRTHTCGLAGATHRNGHPGFYAGHAIRHHDIFFPLQPQRKLTMKRIASILTISFASALMLAATGCAVTRDQQTVGAYIDDASITTTVKGKFIEDKAVAASLHQRRNTQRHSAVGWLRQKLCGTQPGRVHCAQCQGRQNRCATTS
jgi:hypothetical protein